MGQTNISNKSTNNDEIKLTVKIEKYDIDKKIYIFQIILMVKLRLKYFLMKNHFQALMEQKKNIIMIF